MLNIDGDDLALVMSGGGARAAYQVGFLRCLAKHHQNIHFPILTGVSAGAINAAYLANESATFREKADRLADIWKNLTIEQVYRADSPSVARHVVSWGMRLLMGRASNTIKTRSLVDTQPLSDLLHDILHQEKGRLLGVEKNILEGHLKAVAITASSYTTGRSVSWMQGKGIKPWERAHRKSVVADITVDHILASASLPMFFPSVHVDGSWYGDGGIRLTAPLSPAIHLGGRRLLAISTRHIPDSHDMDDVSIDDYPPPAQIIGNIFNAIFLDAFDNDALRLERINELIKRLPEEQRNELYPVRLLILRPSCDLGKLANQYEPELPKAFRFMTRGLGTKETRSNDLLSLIMFQPDYLRHLMDLGYADAEARLGEIEAFINAPSEVWIPEYLP